MRRLAARQHGIVSVTEATELGANPVLIHRLVRRGLVTRIGRRSLTFPGQPETWRMMLAAALNEAGEEAVISHRAAACLHRFDGFGEGPVEVTTGLAHRNRKAIGMLHTSNAIALADRCQVDGFPCTTPARTVVDLAASCSLAELENAVDSVIRNGGASVDFLTRVLARRRGRGHYGGPKLDTVLVDAGGTNKLERRFLRLCRQARLPPPRLSDRAQTGDPNCGTCRLRLCSVPIGGRSGRSDRARQSAATPARCQASPRIARTRSSSASVHVRGRVSTAGSRAGTGHRNLGS